MNALTPNRNNNFALSADGSGRELAGIMIMNGLLRIVTLGIHYFWGKTRVRRYLVSHTRLGGEAFEYTGTGTELFLGTLKVIGLIIVAGILTIVIGKGLETLPDPQIAKFATGFLSVVGGAISTLLFFALIYGSYGYVLSRTQWRGIRFGIRGSVWDVALLAMLNWGLTIITLGLYTPFAQQAIIGHMRNRTHFGSLKFSYDGSGRDLFVTFLITLLLAPFTLGLSLVWYFAKASIYTINHTSLGKIKFNATYTPWQAIGQLLLNGVILLLTLGLAAPWVIIRRRNFTLEHIELSGDFDPDTIVQEQTKRSAIGDAGADVFGGDMGLDIGLM